ncbi:MAG TPA: Ig-like domain-containing protein, partial [Solirubrobacterales bacterium]|nr:Ig-like domain-containing protein [Solirubrobacterales bacterium]
MALLASLTADHARAESSSQRNRPYVGGRLDTSAAYLLPNHSCAIRGNGNLYCWGSGAWGALGYGSSSTVGEVDTPAEVGPVNLGPGRTAVAVATENRNTCVILDNGTVKCWGLGQWGANGSGNTEQLGDNETPASIPPVNLGAGRTAVQIAGGGEHFCAILDNGTVRCWGTGGQGELGYGNPETIGDNETPGSVGPVDLGAGRTAVAISAGADHTCAILDNGQLRCWGHNTSGQLGIEGGPYIGDNETPGSVPAVDLGGGHTAVAVSAGDADTCAILDNGGVKCWGYAVAGELGYGNGSYPNVTLPSTVGTVNLGPGRTAVSISAGPRHTCAVLDNGGVKCWGGGEEGQLGYGNTEFIGDDETPAAVGTVDVGAGRRAISVSSSASYTCATLDDGTIRCWGSGASGYLGYGLGPSSPFFPPVIGDNESPGSYGPVDFGPAHGASETVAGANHTCALFDSGAVRCWGRGSSGQLGYGNTEAIGDNENVGSAGPVQIGGTAVQIAAGANHTCALLSDGTVRCWGLNDKGQLGLGNTNNIGDNELPSAAPTVDLGGASAIQIAAGANHTCALLADGTVRCWGLNEKGQLGLGSTTTVGDNESPASVSAVSLGQPALAIAAGGSHACARIVGGTVRCWGDGANGRLGYASTNTIGDNETPSSGAANIGASGLEVALGGSHTCALLAGAGVRCWGLATNGQLGYANTLPIGDNESPSAAGPVSLGASAKSVATGESHSCAVLVAGAVRCWGLNDKGQLGLGNTNNIGDNEVPITVLAVDLGFGRSAQRVSAGANHTCATLDNGAVRCWGLNSFGQLGLGNTETIGDNETPGSAAPVDFEDDPPVAVNDSGTVAEDSGPTSLDVLANDTDVDAGPKSIQSKTNGSHGTVAITGGGSGLTYTPDANYCGSDSFTYTLNGGSTATVSVAVTCVDDPPVAVADSGTVVEDSSANVIDVLANDTDIDGGTKKIEAKANGAHGTVSLFGGGLGLTYTPDANYCGSDSFTYTLNGGSTATVSVTVTCVDDPPVAVNDSATLAEDSGATAIDVLANDTDVDAGPKSIQSKTNGSH